MFEHFLPRPISRLIRTTFAPPAKIASLETYMLANILEVAVPELSDIRLGRRYHYRPFSIAKKNGGERRILAPSLALKELQQRLLRRYLAQLPVHFAATAYIPGASVVSNAQRHAGQALIATVDLADFFESTSARRVKAFFKKNGWTGEALGVLMRLCVFRDSLPQGAPTSPCLSNLVNFELDEALSELARRAGATYTRYGDDLTFSWSTERIPAYFEAAVQREMLSAGYQVQPRKGWQLHRAAQEPEVTGLVLGRGGGIRAPVRIHREIRKLRWRLWWKRDDKTRARLRGYEGFLNTPGLEK